MTKLIYALHVDHTNLMDSDIDDILFIEKGKCYTLDEFIYNLNRDFINTELYWFRVIDTEL